MKPSPLVDERDMGYDQMVQSLRKNLNKKKKDYGELIKN